MFGKKENEKVENFITYLDSFEDDRKERLEQNKRIDKLLNNSFSHEETTKWKVEGKDEI